jgi:hypothetical protein
VSTNQHPWLPWVTCDDCGKRGYPERADAKRARRRTAGGHLAAYRCSSGLWHVGHRVPGRPRDHYAGRFGTPPITATRPTKEER